MVDHTQVVVEMHMLFLSQVVLMLPLLRVGEEHRLLLSVAQVIHSFLLSFRPPMPPAPKLPPGGVAVPVPVPVTSNFSIVLPPPYVSDLSNCRLLLSFNGRIKTHSIGSNSFDFISQITRQKQKLAIDLDKVHPTTEYISCQVHPTAAGITLRNNFTVKLKSPNNTTVGIMKSKSIHGVQTAPSHPNDRYIVISMEQANAVVYGHHKPTVEMHVIDPSDTTAPAKKEKRRVLPESHKPHKEQNHYLIFKLPKVDEVILANPAGANHDTPITVSLVSHIRPS
jgi:hypothetical protein